MLTGSRKEIFILETKPISEAHDYMLHKEYFVGGEKKENPVLDFEKVMNFLSFFPHSRHKQLQRAAFCRAKILH